MIISQQRISDNTSSILIGNEKTKDAAHPYGFYTKTEAVLYNAVISVNCNLVKCQHAREIDLILIDKSLELIPPAHLSYILAQRPEGIFVHDSAGEGKDLRYMGGSNPGRSTSQLEKLLMKKPTKPIELQDDTATPNFIDEVGIIITFGALSKNVEKGFCPTVLHEFGHRMLYKNKLHAWKLSPEENTQLISASRSRSSNRKDTTEGLCDAYMHMLCYGAAKPLGSEAPILNSRSMREALRKCPAFSSMLDSEWKARYQER